MTNNTPASNLVKDIITMKHLAALVSGAKYDVASSFDLKEGDIINVAAPKGAEDKFIKGLRMGLLLDALEVGLLGLLGGNAASNILERHADEELPETSFKFDTDYKVVKVVGTKEDPEHLDLVLMNDEGDTFPIYSGLIALKGSTINNIPLDLLIEKRQGSIH